MLALRDLLWQGIGRLARQVGWLLLNMDIKTERNGERQWEKSARKGRVSVLKKWNKQNKEVKQKVERELKSGKKERARREREREIRIEEKRRKNKGRKRGEEKKGKGEKIKYKTNEEVKVKVNSEIE